MSVTMISKVANRHQFQGVLSAIGNCIMGIVNAIGAIIMAIVNGIVTICDVVRKKCTPLLLCCRDDSADTCSHLPDYQLPDLPDLSRRGDASSEAAHGWQGLLERKGC